MIQDFEYGLKNGKIVSARDVESGIRCNCFCPSCGNRFVAYKGKILRPHFKHLTEVNCNYSFETALHYLAKEIIREKKYLDLPAVSWDLPDTLSNCFQTKEHTSDKQLVKTINWQRVYFDEVEVEKPEANFKPDIKCYSSGKPLLIEIKVTHGIDDDKLQKVRNNDVPLLEIDLSSYQHSISRKSLKQLLYPQKKSTVERTHLFKWIHNLKNEKLQLKKQQQFVSIVEFLKQNYKLIKLYGKNRGIYNCPLLEKTNGPYQFADTCQYCTFYLGKTELESSQQKVSQNDWAVMCIGHKKYHLAKLLNECGASFISTVM